MITFVLIRSYCSVQSPQLTLAMSKVKVPLVVFLHQKTKNVLISWLVLRHCLYMTFAHV